MIAFERFEAAKMKRFVMRYSKPYVFQRSILNEYKQPIKAFVDVCKINGVYHEHSYKYISGTQSDNGEHFDEIQPMILCMKDELSELIKTDDRVIVNGKKMKVEKIKDINNCGFAYDISLRYIDDGTQA